VIEITFHIMLIINS